MNHWYTFRSHLGERFPCVDFMTSERKCPKTGIKSILEMENANKDRTKPVPKVKPMPEPSPERTFIKNFLLAEGITSM